MRLDDPAFERKFHLGVTVFSLLLVPPSALWLANSLPYVVALSVFAILYSAIASYQAAKAEEELKKEIRYVKNHVVKVERMLQVLVEGTFPQ